ncbi:uncharacterized protein LOC125495470 [Beta vulgaris subsp. vulgaris]|uniref:uncharacterized protein LOC125495470 n=1 Tax=Beta vulgaris subsp. vulgaris TaxID=3555 RepID=UPI002036A10E|nr:uncharacterized protein LOC125495470 [Beta vulgaris subsp. vulgaris]
MARNSKVKKTVISSNPKQKGPNSDSQAKKTRTMDEILGVTAMEFQSEQQSEEDDVRDIQNSMNTHRFFSEWLTSIHTSAEKVKNGKQSRTENARHIDPIPILQMSDNEVLSNSSEINANSSNVESRIKIEMEDVQSEVDYWSSSVICYVLGANPPPYVMEGFIRRIWRNYGVDKVAVVKSGIYIVRFSSMEKKDLVLKESNPFFDNKPVIVKNWIPDMDITKEQIECVPVWIQLRLDFKYWSERCLSKIVSSIGKFLKVDGATAKREKLQYARILVEMKIGQDLPDQITIVNERSLEMVLGVVYEWKPIECAVCRKLGHSEIECNKKEPQKEWRVKKVVQPMAEQQKEDDQVFKIVTQKARTGWSMASPVPVQNTFSALEVMEEQVMVGSVACAKGELEDIRGGDFPDQHG